MPKKITFSIIINKHQLNFDTCETDAELRSSAERVLSSMSGEELRKILLFTNGKTDYLYTDNYFKDIELEIFKPEVSDYFTTLQHI